MKTSLFSLLFALLVCLSSCEGRTGYLDEGQENTLSLLTEKEWLMVYSETSLGYTQTYNSETSVYFFSLEGNGWTAHTCLNDETEKKELRYFQWTFTTENFTVIQLAGNAEDGYWLIKKLTPTELWVQTSVKDPVLYPNQYSTFYKFKSRQPNK